jgi:hypothetical protein
MPAMLRALVACGLLAASPALAQDPPPPASSGEAAGVIDFVEGNAMIEAKGGAARLGRVGDAVYPADTVTTFAAAELHLKMADGAYLSVRENTKLTITEYVANGGDDDRSLIDLARGAFRSITGWIGRRNPRNYEVRTPIVTIGVRGTDHEPTYLLPGDPRGEPGAYDKVNEGRTVMRSDRGAVEVTPNRAGFFHADRSQAPRVLPSVPAFFRPARNEQRFQQRAQASVRTLDVQRRQRNEALRKAPTFQPSKPGAKKDSFSERLAEKKTAIQMKREEKKAAHQQQLEQKKAARAMAAETKAERQKGFPKGFEKKAEKKKGD